MSEPGVPVLALFDRAGRVWRWNPQAPRRPDDLRGVYQHRDVLRTEREIENEGEPVIQVCVTLVCSVR
ncbi:MAG: hypothetical protein ACRDQ5_16755, partial [Sciscionella sp.]